MIQRRDFLYGFGAGLANLGLSGRAAAGLLAAPPLTGAISERLSEFVRTHRLAGLSVAVARGDQPVGFWGGGRASLPFDAPVTERTLFHVGSTGKHVTSVAILQLADAGRVDLDQPVGRYVTGLPEAVAARTLRTLMNQTSGIPDYVETLTDWDRPQPREAVIKAMDRPMQFAPDESWYYSNSNYVLLGWVIEDVSGLSYVRYVEDRLLRPAGAALARADASEEVIPLRAEPYQRTADGFLHALRMENKASASADGGLLFSAADIAPWGAALSGTRLISAKMRKEAISPGRLKSGRIAPYGFGWFVEQTRGKPFHSHGGNVPGFAAQFLQLPSADLTVALMANSMPSGPIVELSREVAEAFAPGSTYISLPAAGDGSDARSRRLRQFLTRPQGAKTAEGLAPELALRLDTPRGLPRTAEIGSLVPVESYKVVGGTMERYRVTTAAGVSHRLVGWTPDDLMFWIW